MVTKRKYLRLQYEKEILWARYAVRDRFLQEVAQTVYDNVGQVLALVKVELSLLTLETEAAKEGLLKPGLLLGKAIDDLRRLCRAFSPEKSLVIDGSLIAALDAELQLLYPRHLPVAVSVTGSPLMPEAGQQLIAFRMVQEILLKVWQQEPESLHAVQLSFRSKNIQVNVDFQGELVGFALDDELTENTLIANESLSLTKRVSLLGGRLTAKTKKNGCTRITLLFPYKNRLYG